MTRRCRGLVLADVIICVVLIVLVLGAVVPLWARTRESAWRVKCASNLRQIALAMSYYAAANGGAFPRTTYDPTSTAVTQYTGATAADPFAPGGPSANDVTAALFLLLRTQDITTSVFVCPRTTRESLEWDDRATNPRRWSNFPSEEHLGYSYANPYPGAVAERAGYALDTATFPAAFVVAADMNPGDPAMTKLTPASKSREMKAGNTRNHERDGQNVLFADWHVEFLQNPFVGVSQDNIYAHGPSGANGTGGTGVVGPPAGPGDTVLLPIATTDPGMRYLGDGRAWNATFFALFLLTIGLFLAYRLVRGLARRSGSSGGEVGT